MSGVIPFTDGDFERHVYDAGFYIPKGGKLVPVFGDAARLEANRLANELNTSPIYVAGACIGGRYGMLGQRFAHLDGSDRSRSCGSQALRDAYTSLDDAYHAYARYCSTAEDAGECDESIRLTLLETLHSIESKLREMDELG